MKTRFSTARCAAFMSKDMDKQKLPRLHVPPTPVVIIVCIFIELTNWREMLSNRYVAPSLSPSLTIIFIYVSQIIKRTRVLFYFALSKHLNCFHVKPK